jgi:hypothetical protein
MSSSEPKWMQSIPNDFVCNYFWAYSAVILIGALIIVASLVYLLITTSKMRGVLSLLIIQTILSYGLLFFLYVCLYLLCSRSLLERKQ